MWRITNKDTKEEKRTWVVREGKDGRYITKTIRIPEEMCLLIDYIGEKSNISLNKVIIQALGYALDHLEFMDSNKTAGSDAAICGINAVQHADMLTERNYSGYQQQVG